MREHTIEANDGSRVDAAGSRRRDRRDVISPAGPSRAERPIGPPDGSTVDRSETDRPTGPTRQATTAGRCRSDGRIHGPIEKEVGRAVLPDAGRLGPDGVGQDSPTYTDRPDRSRSEGSAQRATVGSGPGRAGRGQAADSEPGLALGPRAASPGRGKDELTPISADTDFGPDFARHRFRPDTDFGPPTIRRKSSERHKHLHRRLCLRHPDTGTVSGPPCRSSD